MNVFVVQASAWGGLQSAPSTRPAKVARVVHHTRLHRTPFDVPCNPPKLRAVQNQPVKALMLPKRSSDSQYPVGLHRGPTLDALHDPRSSFARCHQHVHVIRHDHPVVQLEAVRPFDLPRHQFRNLRRAQVRWAAARFIEETVHQRERRSGVLRLGPEVTSLRQTAVQPERDEHRHADGMSVRQPALTKVHLTSTVHVERPLSHQISPVANRRTEAPTRGARFLSQELTAGHFARSLGINRLAVSSWRVRRKLTLALRRRSTT